MAGRISGKTIKQKLGALKSWHIDLGLPTASLEGDGLYRLIRGIQQWHGEKPVKQALPITLPILRAVVSAIKANPTIVGGTRAAKVLIAAFTTAFACFLRAVSFTYTVFDASYDLCRRHLHLDANPPYVHLPASKTDPFRRGVNIILPRGEDETCCIKALKDMVENYPAPADHPLFSLSPARPDFPRSVVIDSLLKRSLRLARIPGEYTGHSFRRGAATWAASVGMSGEEIKTLGRWASSSFERYIDTPAATIYEIGCSLYTRPSTLPSSGMVDLNQVFDPDA